MKTPGFLGRFMPTDEVEKFIERRRNANYRTASQPWGEFWRNLALEAAIVGGLVGLFALAMWLWRVLF